MGNAAKVQDTEALKDFRIALLKFAEKVTSALGEADSEVRRITMWLENEQTSHWTSEMRRRQEIVLRCKEALRFKQVFKSSTGGKNSTVDEEKALSLALRRLAEAEQKAVNVKKWIRQYHRESHLYSGSVQRLATTVASDIPSAAAKILRMIAALEKYLALQAPDLGPEFSGSGAAASMTFRGADERAGYGKLRQTTPIAAVKDRATAGDPGITWTAGELAPGDSEQVAKIAFELPPIDNACTLIIAAGVESCRRIYLERSEPAFPGDSGWFIGPADNTPIADCQSLRVEDILRHRPDFARLLALPTGALIVIDSAGIAAVLNGKDEDSWNLPVPPAEGSDAKVE